MLKSKHSGWTWDLRRTPFGGGGGFLSSVTDPISSALGTDGGGGGRLGALASVDKTVNNIIPGGWITVGALAAGGLALAYAPEVMAFAEANGVTPAIASETLGIPAVEVPAEAGGTAALNASAPAVGAASPSGIAATQSAIGLGSAPTGLATSSVGMGGTVGAGSLAGIAGSETAAGLGALGTGLTAEQLAAYEAANPGMSTSDIVKAANKARQLASALNPSGGTPTSQQLSQFKTATQPALTAATPLARANQSAFMGTTQEPTSIQNPLANTQNFLAQLAQEGTQAVPTNNLANLLRTA